MANGLFGTTYYLLSDALGSTRLVTTTNAVIFFSSNYQPYGVGYGMSGVEEFMYTGKLMDAITGLYYFGARFYDYAVGRFITEDSYSGRREDPSSLNRYTYARDNPLRFVDVNGHATIEADCEDESTCNYGGWATPVAYYAPPSPASLVNPAVVINVAPPPTSATSTPTHTTTRCASDPDLCLTQSGNNQYGPAPPTSTPSDAPPPPQTTTTTATTTYATTTNGGNIAGAAAVLTAGAILTAAATYVAPDLAAEAAAFLSQLALMGPAGAAAGGVSVAAPYVVAGILAFATGYTMGYLIANGPNATPQGAFNAFITGMQFIPSVFRRLP